MIEDVMRPVDIMNGRFLVVEEIPDGEMYTSVATLGRISLVIDTKIEGIAGHAVLADQQRLMCLL